MFAHSFTPSENNIKMASEHAYKLNIINGAFTSFTSLAQIRITSKRCLTKTSYEETSFTPEP